MNNDLIPYGSYPYGIDGYKGGPTNPSTSDDTSGRLHYYALKKLWPLPYLQGVLDDHFTITGHALDTVFYQDNDLEREMFPDTAVQLLSSYERIFDTTNAGSITARQANIIAHERVLVNKDGRLTKQHYINIAAGLGYDSTIVEHFGDAFISAFTAPPASVLPHAVWESGRRWEWDLDSTGSTAPADQTSLMSIITEVAPAWSKVNFFFA